MDTSHNLLRHAKSDFESEAWDRLVYIYEPLIVRWLTRFGITVRDIPDITQEVFLAAAHDLVRFEHNGRPGAFRNWLKTIALNRCRRHWHQSSRQVSTVQLDEITKQLDQMADPNSRLCQIWNQEYDDYVLRGLLALMNDEFDESTMNVFREVALQGESPADVARKHGWTIGRVYRTRFYVMQKLRAEGKKYLD